MKVAQLMRSARSMWNHGDEDEEFEEPQQEPESEPATDYSSYRSDKPGYAAASSGNTNYGGGSTAYGGGSGMGGVRKLQPVRAPRTRDKNIYTLRPTSVDEAAIAADYLKTGSATILNLETIDKITSVRIIDFMSGVCYGLDGQGHAMKLGENLFLFTPNDFEISSDETDYGENTDFFFKDVAPGSTAKPVVDSGWINPGAPIQSNPSYAATPERRTTWER